MDGTTAGEQVPEVFDDAKLGVVLADFAHTMLGDFRIQTILDRLVERVVDVLPVSGAGVTLIGDDLLPHHVAASDPRALQYERLQTELGQGPCLTAFQSGEPVAIPDLAGESRYPQFTPAACSAGLAAVYTFPLRGGNGSLGALDLYQDQARELNARTLAAAATLADVAAAYLRNATARQQAQDLSDDYRASSLHDPLTGLPNRALLRERLAHAAQRAHRSHTTCAVLFTDLDRFKRINDTHGHAEGDELLLAVATRLGALVRPGDTLARVGGDEFVFLCEDLAAVQDAELLADRVNAAFQAPFVLPGADVLLSASVGISYAGPGEAITPQLLIDADTAMYQAKRSGGGVHRVIDLRMSRAAQDNEALGQDLRATLAGTPAPGTPATGDAARVADGLALAYQPVVSLDDGHINGVEALLRWTHPARGVVSAPAAVRAAEQHGLIVSLGQWALQRACQDWRDWLPLTRPTPLSVAVNISGRQLAHPDFLASIEQLLEHTAVPPGALVLELTENVFLDDSHRTTQILTELRSLGLRLSLDDFGTGYSSLGYLQRFPVDILKIDKGFVRNIGQDRTATAIATAITQLARALGIAVIAEGVETEQQHAALVDIGAQDAQGYLYSRPLPSDRLQALLAAHPDDRPIPTTLRDRPVLLP